MITTTPINTHTGFKKTGFQLIQPIVAVTDEENGDIASQESKKVLKKNSLF